MMDLHLSSARSSNKNSQRWSIFLYLCCGRVGTEQVWTGRAPEGSTTLLHFALSSMSFLSLKSTIHIVFGEKRKYEERPNCWCEYTTNNTDTVLKRASVHCYACFAPASTQLTRPKMLKESKLINLMFDIESHLTGQTEPIWPQSMPITQKYQIYHLFVTWLFSARRIGDWIKLLSPGNIWGRSSRINVIFFNFVTSWRNMQHSCPLPELVK